MASTHTCVAGASLVVTVMVSVVCSILCILVTDNSSAISRKFV